MTLVSGNYKVYADTRGVSSWRGPQLRVGLPTTAIFGDLSGYFLGNVRDKTIVKLYVCNSAVSFALHDQLEPAYIDKRS